MRHHGGQHFDVEEIRRRLCDPRALVDALGLGHGAKRAGNGVAIACPWHADSTPSCSVTRGHDGTIRVRCHGCGVTGDALHLVAAAHRIDVKRDFVVVLRLAAELAGVTASTAATPPAPRPRAPEPPPVYPAADELAALWTACAPVNRTQADPHLLDLGVAFYLARRAWFPPALARLDVARVLPLPHACAWPSWWPRRWTDTYRLAVLAYDAGGVARSLHARAIVPEAQPKTRWPLACASSGLVFANAAGVGMLRGESSPAWVYVFEGASDFIAGALAAADEGDDAAILGVTTGSAQAFARIAWPAGVRVSLMTDADEAGEKLARDIAAAVPPSLHIGRGNVRALQGVLRGREG